MKNKNKSAKGNKEVSNIEQPSIVVDVETPSIVSPEQTETNPTAIVLVPSDVPNMENSEIQEQTENSKIPENHSVIKKERKKRESKISVVEEQKKLLFKAENILNNDLVFNVENKYVQKINGDLLSLDELIKLAKNLTLNVLAGISDVFSVILEDKTIQNFVDFSNLDKKQNAELKTLLNRTNVKMTTGTDEELLQLLSTFKSEKFPYLKQENDKIVFSSIEFTQKIVRHITTQCVNFNSQHLISMCANFNKFFNMSGESYLFNVLKNVKNYDLIRKEILSSVSPENKEILKKYLTVYFYDGIFEGKQKDFYKKEFSEKMFSKMENLTSEEITNLSEMSTLDNLKRFFSETMNFENIVESYIKFNNERGSYYYFHEKEEKPAEAAVV